MGESHKSRHKAKMVVRYLLAISLLFAFAQAGWDTVRFFPTASCSVPLAQQSCNNNFIGQNVCEQIGATDLFPCVPKTCEPVVNVTGVWYSVQCNSNSKPADLTNSFALEASISDTCDSFGALLGGSIATADCLPDQILYPGSFLQLSCGPNVNGTEVLMVDYECNSDCSSCTGSYEIQRGCSASPLPPVNGLTIYTKAACRTVNPGPTPMPSPSPTTPSTSGSPSPSASPSASPSPSPSASPSPVSTTGASQLVAFGGFALLAAFLLM